MKRLRAVMACLVCAGFASAQDNATARPPHGVVVLGLTWSRGISAPRTTLPREEPSGGQRPNPDRKLRAPSPIPSSPFPYLEKLPYFYVYSLKVKNAGPKKIRGVYWEYVTTDPVSGVELGRRQIINHQEVRPGEVTTLRVEYPSPPTNVVTPEGLGTDERSPFESRAEIRCVLYADSKVWEGVGAEEACTELRQIDAKVRGRRMK